MLSRMEHALTFRAAVKSSPCWLCGCREMRLRGGRGVHIVRQCLLPLCLFWHAWAAHGLPALSCRVLHAAAGRALRPSGGNVHLCCCRAGAWWLASR